MANAVKSAVTAAPAKAIDGKTPAGDETADQTRAIDRFLLNLTVVPIRNSRLVDIRYDSPEPATAARIVNAIAKNYIDQSLEFKFMSSREANDWLGQRLAEQRKQVEEAEVKLQRYREQNDAISLKDRENIVVQKLSDLNTAVTQAKTDRFQKEALYNQLQSLRDQLRGARYLSGHSGEFVHPAAKSRAGAVAVAVRAAWREAGSQSPRHGEVAPGDSSYAVQAGRRDREVVQSVKNEYLAVLAKENSLIGALNSQKGDALAMNRKAIDYNVLDREVQSSRQLYENLLQRAKETESALSSGLATFESSIARSSR